MHQREEPHGETAVRYTVAKNTPSITMLICPHCPAVNHPSVLCPSSAEPCPPSQLTASVNCSNNSAKLTWNSSANAVSYTGKAVNEDGHNVTCNTRTDLSCNLEGLYCGKKYTFTVSASDSDCQSPDSKPVIQTTGEKQ